MISLEIDYPKAKKESQGKRANPAKITVIEVVEDAYTWPRLGSRMGSITAGQCREADFSVLM